VGAVALGGRDATVAGAAHDRRATVASKEGKRDFMLSSIRHAGAGVMSPEEHAAARRTVRMDGPHRRGSGGPLRERPRSTGRARAETAWIAWNRRTGRCP
jgi:hypothetical protein